MKTILTIILMILCSYSFSQDSGVNLRINLHPVGHLGIQTMECEQVTSKSVVINIPLDVFTTHNYSIELYPNILDIDRDYYLIIDGKKPRKLEEGETQKIGNTARGSGIKLIHILIENAKLNECQSLSEHFILSLIPL